MTFSRIALLGVACAFTLGACGVGKDVAYIRDSLTGKKNDDEAVTTNAPLSRPPDFALRPPADPKKASTNRTARTARTVLQTNATPTGGAVRPTKPGERSAGENELLRKAGIESTTSNVVRRTVDIENNREKEGEKKFVDKVLKYDPNRKGTDTARGRDATQAAPIIKRSNEL